MDSGESRLPAHIEVSGLIRAVESAGGFATVNAKGERDGGTLMVVCCEKGQAARSYERMPSPEGGRKWVLSRRQDADNPAEFWEYCTRRARQDSDLWVVEIDIANGERFIGMAEDKG